MGGYGEHFIVFCRLISNRAYQSFRDGLFQFDARENKTGEKRIKLLGKIFLRDFRVTNTENAFVDCPQRQSALIGGSRYCGREPLRWCGTVIEALQQMWSGKTSGMLRDRLFKEISKSLSGDLGANCPPHFLACPYQPTVNYIDSQRR